MPTDKIDAKKFAPSELINIQKLIVLIEEDVYEDFLCYLKSINAHLPARLIETIRRRGFDFQYPEKLCEKIYQKPAVEARASFNQLAAHTFRLSEYLALNYPSYLLHNMIRIEKLIADRKMQQAQFLVEILLDLAQKVDDFTTQLLVLKYMSQQEHMYKQPAKALTYVAEIQTARENERIVDEIYRILRADFTSVMNAKKKDTTETAEAIKLLRSYHEHPCWSISLMSRYVVIYIKAYHRGSLPAHELHMDNLEAFEKDLHNHSYILLPYLFDLKMSLHLLKLNDPRFDANSRDGQVQIANIKKHYTMVRYWGAYLNMPELYIVMLKCIHLVEEMSHQMYHKGYPAAVPAKTMAYIKETADEGLRIIEQHKDTKGYVEDIMNLSVMTAAALILQGDEHITEGINMLEINITTYQQVKKSRSIGNCYLLLMIAYFAKKDYKQCVNVYTRYLKIAKNKDMYEQVDAGTKTYYYFAKWLLDHDPQNIAALKEVYAEITTDPFLSFPLHTIRDMASYFHLEDIISAG